ncbi:helix-turn-helix domain-containing protein [Novosphingobium barchaimii]|uniref:helix-turn-helix domain-containing protein n=1 Tax=Novosphingobium barchaimii TaxID=1420591 RepID=UPI0011E0234E|nr:hypothetical protein [Novosphingobium barchaimii]
MIVHIRNEADYEVAIERPEVLFHAEGGTPEAVERDTLSTLVDRYEDENYPIAPPTPLEAVLFRMEQQI